MLFPYISYVKGQPLTLHIENVWQNVIFEVLYLLTHTCNLFEIWVNPHAYIKFRLLGATIMFVHQTIGIMKLCLYLFYVIIVSLNTYIKSKQCDYLLQNKLFT